MTQPNRVSKGLSFALCALAFLFFVPVSFSEEMGVVKIGNKEFVLPLPKGFCESSNTIWGRSYTSFLSDLGISAGGDPEILSVFRDCESLRSENLERNPRLWGYLAFDRKAGRVWLGQGTLNRRLRRALSIEDPKTLENELQDLTDTSFDKMKANIRIGEIKVICKPLETKRAFMTCGFTRLVIGSDYQDVYLISVVFLRNREVITLTLYRNADEPGDLASLVEVGKEYLMAL